MMAVNLRGCKAWVSAAGFPDNWWANLTSIPPINGSLLLPQVKGCSVSCLSSAIHFEVSLQNPLFRTHEIPCSINHWSLSCCLWTQCRGWATTTLCRGHRSGWLSEPGEWEVVVQWKFLFCKMKTILEMDCTIMWIYSTVLNCTLKKWLGWQILCYVYSWPFISMDSTSTDSTNHGLTIFGEKIP